MLFDSNSTKPDGATSWIKQPVHTKASMLMQGTTTLDVDLLQWCWGCKACSICLLWLCDHLFFGGLGLDVLLHFTG